MQREVALKDLELSRLAIVPIFEALQPAVDDLRQLIQLYEELSKHLLLDWLLISSNAFDFVPQLDLKWLAESLFNLLAINNINFDEVRFLN